MAATLVVYALLYLKALIESLDCSTSSNTPSYFTIKRHTTNDKLSEHFPRVGMTLLTSPTAAPGEAKLKTLLVSLEISLHPETFVFSTLANARDPPPSLQSQMIFREAEGLTLILTYTEAASNNLEFVFPCRMITLNVHSSLEAVGLIAFIAARLTEKGISVNPVSGFFHDHLFVPKGSEDETLKILQDISIEAQEEGRGNRSS